MRVRDSNHLHGGFIVASSGFQLPGKPIEPGLGLGNLLLDRGFLFLRFGCIISLLQVCQFRARLLHLPGNCLIIPDECLGRAELLRRDICRKLGGLCVQLLFCRRELRFGLRLFLGKLLARDFNLSAGFLDLLSSVFDLFFAVNQLFAVFLQLLFSVFQLLFRIRQLLLRVRLSVFILLYAIQVFLIAIVVFLLGFLLNVQKTLLTQLFRLRLQPVRFRIQKVVIFIGVDSVASIQPQMDLRVIIVVQRRLRHEEIILQRTAANRGCAPVHIHVQGRRHIAHNGKGLLHHLFQGVGVVAVCNGDFGPQYAVIIAETVGKAFVIPLRHPPAPESHLVHTLRDGVEPIHRLLIAALPIGNQVDIIDALSVGNTLQVRELPYIFVGPPVVADHPQVKHILLIHEDLARSHHVRFGHQKTYEQASAQGDNQGNGQISTEGFDYGLAQIFAHGVPAHDYHSISEMFWGCSFIVTDATVPFFTRITRSAMAVKAPLWVIMITVIPVFRPVSCKSCKMALPV